jgi:hypothetical protein
MNTPPLFKKSLFYSDLTLVIGWGGEEDSPFALLRSRPTAPLRRLRPAVRIYPASKMWQKIGLIRALFLANAEAGGILRL